MNRREFTKYLTAVVPFTYTPGLWANREEPEIAFTFDDPKTDGGAGLSWQEINERMLRSLAKHNLKTVLFVTGKRVDSDVGRQLVAAWDQSGHAIGNHSYSHLFFNHPEVTLAQFETDVVKNEPLTRAYSHFLRLFRYPYFKEGETLEKRNGMRSYLQQQNYRIGRATIDASDWAISARLENCVKSNPKAKLDGYREFFLRHIWERSQFYDSLARRVLKQPVRHTLVLHHNPLNALFLDDLISMFLEKRWQPIDAKLAFSDPVYDLNPDILPAGESLIWALAKETGRFENELRYPGEDDVYENPKMNALKL